MTKRKVVAVVGETASGKTSLAIAIAKKYDGEVISADSRAVFKGMDIGTAKPTKDEMKRVPHYGIDLVEPGERYTAAQFKEYADALIEDISARGKLPIIAGGTGLYVNGVLYGYSFGSDIDEAKRSDLNNKTVVELTTIVESMGIAVSQSTKHNKRHLVRIIERGSESSTNTKLKYDALLLGLTMSKTKLRERIEQRVEQMFRNGLRKEYNELRQKYEPNSEAFTGIGYKEFIDWENGNASMSEVKRNIVKNTMNVLAKHQRTWFKRDKNIRWVESEEEALVLVDGFMDNK